MLYFCRRQTSHMPDSVTVLLLFYAIKDIWFQKALRTILILQTGSYIVSHKIHFFARAADENLAQ